MKIAVLAWGSVVWERGVLEVAADFMPNGPHLPVEFCRVSGGERLTLVIDETFGATCPTYAAPSSFGDLSAAILNLWVREGSKGEPLPEDVRRHGRVGFTDVSSGQKSDIAMQRHPHAVAAITAWAKANGYDAAIWTALASRLHEPGKRGEPFTVNAAIRYLEDLEKRDAATFGLALTYSGKRPLRCRRRCAMQSKSAGHDEPLKPNASQPDR